MYNNSLNVLIFILPIALMDTEKNYYYLIFMNTINFAEIKNFISNICILIIILRVPYCNL